MTEKELREKVIDILEDYREEYDSNPINRPLIPRVYADQILGLIEGNQDSKAGARLDPYAEFRINPKNLIEAKYEVGDKIRYLPSNGTIMTIEKVENDEYVFANNMGRVSIDDGNQWTLVEKYNPCSDCEGDGLPGTCASISSLGRCSLEYKKQKSQTSLPAIQWTGDNLKEVIEFTGFYKDGFEKWFHSSWEEYENYIHTHNDIFKIFNPDSNYHYECLPGTWIVKTPDNRVYPLGAIFSNNKNDNEI